MSHIKYDCQPKDCVASNRNIVSEEMKTKGNKVQTASGHSIVEKDAHQPCVKPEQIVPA
jgi:hypothetical protein